MRTRTVALVACALAFPIIPLRAQEILYGDHVITGELRVGGNFLDLGTSSTNSGVTWQYNDDGTNSTLSVTASQPTAGYLWEDNSVGALVTKMKLDGTNALTLFVADGISMGIFLNPGGASSFSGSLLVNGTNNLMPNQTLSDSNSVLTRRLADDRYLQTALSTFAVGGSNFVVSTNGRVGVGTASPTYDVSLDGQTNRSISLERSTSGAGKNLTISAGAGSSATNQAGGSLVLSSGGSTGNAGGEILFQTPQSGGSGSSLNSMATRLRINGSGVNVPGTLGVGVGAGTLGGALDVSSSLNTLVLGADYYATTRSTNSSKMMGVFMPHFNGTGLLTVAQGTTVSSNTAVLTVGGSGSGRTFTELHLITAPNTDYSGGGFAKPRIKVMQDGKIIINAENVATADFQVKGTANDDLLYVSAATNRVGIGTSAPAATLHVVGGAQVDGTLNLPNQTITNASSAITVGQADGRYLQTAADALVIGGTSFVVSTNGHVGVGTASPTFDLSLGGGGDRAISVEQAESGGGNNLTISAGMASAGTDQAGGTLILAAGASTGSGTGNILFQTPQSDWGGASTNALATRMWIHGSGSVGIGEGALSGHTGIRGTLDISASVSTLVLGSDSGSTNRMRTDGLQKRMQILMAPFNTNRSGLQVMSATVNSNDASLALGMPPSGAGSSFTSIHFGTAPHTTNGIWWKKRLSILSDGKIVVNESKISTADFQIKGGLEDNLFYVSATNNSVGIGTNAPAATLHVAGGAQVDGALQVQGALRIVPQGDLAMGVFTNQP